MMMKKKFEIKGCYAQEKNNNVLKKIKIERKLTSSHIQYIFKSTINLEKIN